LKLLEARIVSKDRERLCKMVIGLAHLLCDKYNLSELRAWRGLLEDPNLLDA
jgi:hypothetical protein